MALTWGDLNGKVQDKIVPTVADVVYKSSPVFIRIRTQNGQQFDGGIKIRQNIGYAELNGGPFSRGQSFNYGLTAWKQVASKLSLIDSDAVIANEAEPIMSDRDRLSERESLRDYATVGPHGKKNRENMAEMTISPRAV
jgi:hypothetical protein